MSVDGGGGERWGYKYILMRISVELNGSYMKIRLMWHTVPFNTNRLLFNRENEI